MFCYCCAEFSGARWFLMLKMKDLVIIRVQHLEFRILSFVSICICSKLFSFIWSTSVTDISSKSSMETDTKSMYLEHTTCAEVQPENSLSDKSWLVCLRVPFCSERNLQRRWMEICHCGVLFQQEQNCSSVLIPVSIFSKKVTYVNSNSQNRFCWPFLGIVSFIGFE